MNFIIFFSKQYTYLTQSLKKYIKKTIVPLCNIFPCTLNSSTFCFIKILRYKYLLTYICNFLSPQHFSVPFKYAEIISFFETNKI